MTNSTIVNMLSVMYNFVKVFDLRWLFLWRRTSFLMSWCVSMTVFLCLWWSVLSEWICIWIKSIRFSKNVSLSKICIIWFFSCFAGSFLPIYMTLWVNEWLVWPSILNLKKGYCPCKSKLKHGVKASESPVDNDTKVLSKSSNVCRRIFSQVTLSKKSPEHLYG